MKIHAIRQAVYVAAVSKQGIGSTTEVCFDMTGQDSNEQDVLIEDSDYNGHLFIAARTHTHAHTNTPKAHMDRGT